MTTSQAIIGAAIVAAPALTIGWYRYGRKVCKYRDVQPTVAEWSRANEIEDLHVQSSIIRGLSDDLIESRRVNQRLREERDIAKRAASGLQRAWQDHHKRSETEGGTK